MDLRSRIDTTIKPHEYKKIPTGVFLYPDDDERENNIHMAIGVDIQIRPRSGLAIQHGVTVLNSPGTIDIDYVDEICVILINHGDKEFTINKYDRIAQIVISDVSFQPLIPRLTESPRRGGFGSTGSE